MAKFNNVKDIKGGGSAARVAKENMETMQKEKVEEIKETLTDTKVEIKGMTKVDLIVVPLKDGKIELMTKDKLSAQYNSIDPIYSVEKRLYGWVTDGIKLYPSYDMEVYVGESKHKFLKSKAFKDNGGFIPLSKFKVVHHKLVDGTRTITAPFGEALKWDGIHFIPGKGARYVVGIQDRNIKDYNDVDFELRHITSGFSGIIEYYPVNNGLRCAYFGDILGVSDFIGNSLADVENYTFEFDKTNNSAFKFLTSELNGKTFKVPANALSEVKSIANAIDNGTVSLNKVMKLGELIHKKIGLVLTESLGDSILVKIPEYTDENKIIYQNVDITENEYNKLIKGIEMPTELYGLEEVYTKLTSGKYDLPHIQFVVDYYRNNK